MIAYIEGKIDRLTPTDAIIDAFGVGYLIQISLTSYTALQGKERSRLWISEIIREDTHDLYGFVEETERDCFEKLISVSGVGPSTARLILSSYSPNELSGFIDSGNVERIKMIKGIGLKTAQRIIVDLKGKIEWKNEDVHQASSALSEEAFMALKMLGFADPAIKKALQSLQERDPHLSVEETIKQALKIL